MSIARFRLRSLMAFVALAAAGSWVAVTAWRYWTAVSLLRSEAGPALLPYYAALSLAVIVALSLIVVGVIGLAARLRVVLRAASPGPSRARPDR